MAAGGTDLFLQADEESNTCAVDELDVGGLQQTMTAISEHLVQQQEIIAHGLEIQPGRGLEPLPVFLRSHRRDSFQASPGPASAKLQLPPLGGDAPTDNPQIFDIAT